MTQLAQTPPLISETERCARLNDDCRWSRGPRSNYRHMITIGVQDLITGDNGAATILRQAQLQTAIRNYHFKDGDGDLRDFGAIQFAGQKLFFKIDAYDRALLWFARSCRCQSHHPRDDRDACLRILKAAENSPKLSPHMNEHRAMVEFTKFLGQLGRSWWLGTLINAALVAVAIFLLDLPL